MKKILSMIMVLVVLICITGCQKHNSAAESSEGQNKAENNKQNPQEQVHTNGTIRSLSCGNDNGYYLIESSQNGYSNLMYIDYKTGREIYLCAKPNCKHSSNSCASYLPNDGEMWSNYSVYCTDKSVYLFYSGMSSFFTGSIPPAIYQMDLNGENRKVIYTAQSGTEINRYMKPYTDGKVLYFQTQVMSPSKPNKDGIIEMGTSSNFLTSLNLENGKTENLINLQNSSVLAAFRNGLLFSETDGIPKDITDTEKIDEYLRNQKTRICLYLPETKEKILIYTAEPDADFWNSIMYENKLFFLDKDKIQSLDLENKKVETLADGFSLSLSLKGCYDGRLYFEQRDNENRATAWMLELKNKQVNSIKLMTNEPGSEPVFILAETDNDYLVNHRCDRTRHEKDSVMIDENGIEHIYPDYKVDKRYYALISKSDYQNSKVQYQEITEG